MSTERHELHELVKVALRDLDGTEGAAVSLMTGLGADELGDLGGLPR